jgi:phosphoribosyl 1,2-cyclic phosphate phosphodiesterase
MRVTLLGTGDTTGTPTVGCDCGTCTSARARGIERTRFSVHVENTTTGASLLVDLSPDFRHQFLRERVSLPTEAIVTHVHFDHLDGLGNAYRVFSDLTVHAANETDPETGESVAGTVDRKYDYLDTVTVSPQTPFEPFEACGFTVTLVPVDHPPLLCYGLTVESEDAKLAITGDTSYDVPPRSRAVLADADLLLADGIVPAENCQHHPLGGRHHGPDGTPYTFGTKHATREGALALAAELNAARTRLVHVSHFYDEREAFAEPLAVDGEVYDLS